MATRDKRNDGKIDVEDIHWSTETRALLTAIRENRNALRIAQARAAKAKAELQRLEKLANERIERIRKSGLLSTKESES